MADSRPFKNCFLVITQQLIDFGEILHREVEQHEGEQHGDRSHVRNSKFCTFKMVYSCHIPNS